MDKEGEENRKLEVENGPFNETNDGDLRLREENEKENDRDLRFREENNEKRERTQE